MAKNLNELRTRRGLKTKEGPVIKPWLKDVHTDCLGMNSGSATDSFVILACGDPSLASELLLELQV